MQSAAEAVGAARAFVTFATGMQPREHNFQHRHLFFGVQAKRDAAPVVVHRHAAVGVHHQSDAGAKTSQRFVGGVVYYLLHDVQRVVGAGVHARALLHGLQPLEYADGRFAVGLFACGCFVR